MAPPSSRNSSQSRPSSLRETTSLLNPHSSSTNPSTSSTAQFDSDQDSTLSFPSTRKDSMNGGKSNAKDGQDPKNQKKKKKDYGTISPAEREEQAFATLPARLSRAASLDRKRSMHFNTSKPPTKWQLARHRAQYYVPILNWLPKYDTKKLGTDTIAALTLTSMIVPQAMSYSTNLVHSNPIHGLFGVSIPSLVYSVFGTCRQLSVGPEAALSLIMGEVIAKLVETEEHAHYDGVKGGMGFEEKARFTTIITSFIVFEAGAISFLLGFLRLGFLDAVLSRALMRGFITAVGLVILLSQTISILGLDQLLSKQHGASSTVPEKLVFLLTHLKHTHKLTVLVSANAAAILIGMKVVKSRLKGRKKASWIRFVPEVLLVVIGATLLSHILNWNDQGLETLGKISPSAVKFSWPFSVPTGGGGHGRSGKTHYLDYARSCLGTASVIAILGFLDSIVAAKDMASKFDYPISPNRELTALGLSNLISSFMSGTLPGFGSITRTRLAASTGAKTQFASFLTGVFTLGVTFGLLGLLKDLPKCILAVVVGVVVFSILEEAPEDIKFFWRMSAVSEGFMMLLTFFLSLLVSVEVGIITSVCLSMILCIKQSTLTHIKILGRVPGTNSFSALLEDNDDGDSPAEHDYSNSLDLFQPSASNITQGSSGQGVQEELPGILIIRLRDVSLHFANTSALKERLRRLEKYGPERSHPADEPKRSEAVVVVFEMRDVVGIDPGAARVLEEVVRSYGDRDVLIYWVQPQAAVLAVLRKAGIIEVSGGDEHLQPSISKALEVVEERMKDVSRRQGGTPDREERDRVERGGPAQNV